MTTYIIDIAIFLALAFFAWRGAKRGLILTLFSLLAIFVAFFGARAVASTFSQSVADILRPSIQQSINGVLTGRRPALSHPPARRAAPAPPRRPLPPRRTGQNRSRTSPFRRCWTSLGNRSCFPA